MTIRFPFVRIRKRAPKARKKYESKWVILSLIMIMYVTRPVIKYKQKQPTNSKKLRSNMAMSQGNGKNEYSPCNLWDLSESYVAGCWLSRQTKSIWFGLALLVRRVFSIFVLIWRWSSIACIGASLFDVCPSSKGSDFPRTRNRQFSTSNLCIYSWRLW